MITHNARKWGATYTLIKAIAHELQKDKDVLVVNLTTPDLYLRMLEEQGVEAQAEKEGNNFIFKIKSDLTTI